MKKVASCQLPVASTSSSNGKRQAPVFTGNSQLTTGNYSRGFTVLELLVVIGIILVLLGILLPVISKVKTASYSADTQQEVSQLSTAINEYYSIFHAYPGPFTNDQIEAETSGATSGIPLGIANFEIYTDGATNPYGTPSTTPWTVTGTENLVLGLLGGLRIDTTGSPPTNNPVFAPSEVGLGPLSLNPANPRRYSPFIDTKNILWCSLSGPTTAPQVSQSNLMPTNPSNFHDLAGVSAYDSEIPEFVDRFPVPLPILYLRARTGAKGIISDGTTVGIPPISQTVPPLGAYQYDIRDIYAYVTNTTRLATSSENEGIGLPLGRYHNLGQLALPSTITSWPPANPAKAGQYSTDTISNYDAFAYFANFSSVPPSLSQTGDVPANAWANYTGQPRSVDQFILITAGPDRIYGTTDDITSFGDVAQ